MAPNVLDQYKVRGMFAIACMFWLTCSLASPDMHKACDCAAMQQSKNGSSAAEKGNRAGISGDGAPAVVYDLTALRTPLGKCHASFKPASGASRCELAIARNAFVADVMC